MGEKLNTCIICGKQYPNCMSCNDTRNLRPWRSVTDTLEHYKIYLVLSRYNNGYTTANQAKQELSEIEYIMDELKPNIQEKIRSIIDPAKTRKSTKKVDTNSLNSSF